MAQVSQFAREEAKIAVTPPVRSATKTHNAPIGVILAPRLVTEPRKRSSLQEIYLWVLLQAVDFRERLRRESSPERLDPDQQLWQREQLQRVADGGRREPARDSPRPEEAVRHRK